MDTKIEIKEEDPLSDISSQNNREFLTEEVVMHADSETVYLNADYHMTIKTEIQSLPPLQDFCPQEETVSFGKYLIKQMKSESVTCSNSSEIDIKTESEEQDLVSGLALHSEGESENSVTKVEKYSCNHENHSKIEIKEECCWLEPKASYVLEDIKDGDFLSVESSRLCTVSEDSVEKSTLSSAEDSETDIGFFNESQHHDSEGQKSDFKEMFSVEKHVRHKHPSKHINERKIHTTTSYLMQKGVIQTDKKCNICERSFTNLKHLKSHTLIHRGEKRRKCESCDKIFIQLSGLKRHTLTHKLEKLHKCEICEKSFRYPSVLRKHAFIHTGAKPHNCQLCKKSFTRFPDLKRHILTHSGEKPHKCELCEKQFTLLGALKKHLFIHTGEKPYSCETCEKTFVALYDLKRHALIHSTEKPHKCEVCQKSFIRLSQLKNHSFIHSSDK